MPGTHDMHPKVKQYLQGKMKGYQAGGLVEDEEQALDPIAQRLQAFDQANQARDAKFEADMQAARAQADERASGPTRRILAGVFSGLAGGDVADGINQIRGQDAKIREELVGNVQRQYDADAKRAEARARLMSDLQNKLAERQLRQQIERDKNEARLAEANLRREDRQALRAIEAERRQESRQERLDKRLEDEIRQAEKRLAPAVDIQNTLANVEDKLGFALDAAEIKDGQVIVGGEAKDLPGVSIPGLGRRTFYDSDARQLQSAIGKVFNVELKDRSGAAVTTPELERLKEEFASGKFNSEAEMVQALKDYKRLAAIALKNAEAAFRPEVLERYAERGGQTSKQLGFVADNQRPPFEPDEDLAAAARAELERRRAQKQGG